jgi:hypothetical protein
MRLMRSRRVVVGTVVLAAGLVCLAASLVLTFSKTGATAATTTAVSGADATPTQFLDELSAALRSGDTSFLRAHLDPAVIQRFGAAACLAHVGTLKDPTATFQVRSVGAPTTYDYMTGTRTTAVADTIPVSVVYTQNGNATDTTVHLARLADGALGWFTACS